MKLTWDDSGILIFLHVCLFASMSEGMLTVFSHSIVELHLKIKCLSLNLVIFLGC